MSFACVPGDNNTVPFCTYWHRSRLPERDETHNSHWRCMAAAPGGPRRPAPGARQRAIDATMRPTADGSPRTP